MGPCCSLTYKKYLNQDRSIDLVAYQKIVELIRMESPDRFQRLLNKGKLNPENVCTCKCHIIGLEVRH